MTIVDDSLLSVGSLPEPDGQLILIACIGGNQLIRLNHDGTVDTSFSIPVSVTAQIERIEALVLQPDGRLLVGFASSAVSSAQSAVGTIRLNTDG